MQQPGVEPLHNVLIGSSMPQSLLHPATQESEDSKSSHRLHTSAKTKLWKNAIFSNDEVHAAYLLIVRMALLQATVNKHFILLAFC